MKKIFIVAPHFPPSAMPPSQRVRLLVRHFKEFFYHPVVFTVDQYYREEIADPWMIELAGNEYELVKVNCLDQRKTRKFGIGDQGLRMLPFLFFKLLAETKKRKPDFILFPVPPWYIMIIAPFIKRITGVKYGIDFIDPWVRKKSGKDKWKAKASQWIARRLEGFAIKRSSVIFAVSQGILDDLAERWPVIKNKLLVPVPYGVETDDYESLRNQNKDRQNERYLIRYIGAFSDSMLIVVEELLKALKELNKTILITSEFIGTSYAAPGMVKPRMQHFINDLGINDFVIEKPARVSYAEAVQLTGAADILLLIGDMTAYYAASKLMGLIASQKPFFAFLHKDSFPAKFLKECNYTYLVEYSGINGTKPSDMTGEVTGKLQELIGNLTTFNPIPLNEPLFQIHTAKAMTETFAENIQKALHD